MFVYPSLNDTMTTPHHPHTWHSHITRIYTYKHTQDKLYIFGGEYATLDQFHHYRDMWALDLKTNIWQEVPASKVHTSTACLSVYLSELSLVVILRSLWISVAVLSLYQYATVGCNR